MPTRDINEYLESGETDAINLQDVTPDDAVLTKGETSTLIATVTDPIDTRVTRLEEGHEIVLNAICGAVWRSGRTFGSSTSRRIRKYPI